VAPICDRWSTTRRAVTYWSPDRKSGLRPTRQSSVEAIPF